jgi:hypothetical protein
MPRQRAPNVPRCCVLRSRTGPIAPSQARERGSEGGRPQPARRLQRGLASGSGRNHAHGLGPVGRCAPGGDRSGDPVRRAPRMRRPGARGLVLQEPLPGSPCPFRDRSLLRCPARPGLPRNGHGWSPGPGHRVRTRASRTGGFHFATPDGQGGAGVRADQDPDLPRASHPAALSHRAASAGSRRPVERDFGERLRAPVAAAGATHDRSLRAHCARPPRRRRRREARALGNET